MIKTLIPALLIAAALTSCSSMRPVTTSGNRPASSPSQKPVEVKRGPGNEVKFLNDISITAESSVTKTEPAKTKKVTKPVPVKNNIAPVEKEKASDLELKYASLLNIDADLLIDDPLLTHIDEWWGTRYKYGGTTKKGIDCSAFVQTIYLAAFGLALPRTARDQYRFSRIISATELEEGDLVFFNTRGGVSHVGIYLRNNKFAHASVSSGVTVSDMYDPYYMKHFIGAGRIEKSEASALNGVSSSTNN